MALLSGKFQPQMLEIQLGNDIQPQLLELSILNLNLQRIHWVFYPVGSYRNSLVTTMNLNQLALPMMGKLKFCWSEPLAYYGKSKILKLRGQSTVADETTLHFSFASWCGYPT